MLNVRIGKRDLNLLIDIHENQFLGFDQIRKEHFQSNSESTVHNRLTKLVQARYLGRKRISLCLLHQEEKNISSIFTLGKKALSFLQLRFPEKDFRPLRKINYYSLYHDYLLTDLLRALRLKYPE